MEHRELINQVRKVVDDILEESQKKSWNLKLTLNRVFNDVSPMLPIPYKDFAIYTYNESLGMECFSLNAGGNGSFGLSYDELNNLSKKDKVLCLESGEQYLHIYQLDVAGEHFGFTLVSSEKKVDDNWFHELMNEFNEVLDNYLQNIRNAKIKNVTLNKIAKALQDKRLEKCLSDVMDILSETIDFKTFILYFWDPTEGEGSIKYRIFQDNKLLYYSTRVTDETMHQRLIEEGIKLIHFQEPDYLINKFNLSHYKRFHLVQGLNRENAGVLIMDIDHDSLNIVNQDIIQTFCHFLLLRIIDFNKEYNMLSRYFSKGDIHLIIETPDYHNTVLNPKEKEIAILYSDIAGFTKISEAILSGPSEIGDFIDSWILKVCQIIWSHSGVVDKFVGDCVIGLFGPPFFNYTPSECCLNAINAAIDIHRYTDSLNTHERWKKIPDSKLVSKVGMTTGINFAPTFVGNFGSNIDYTGFSSGMNNTARLQSHASFNKIYVMDSVREILSGQNQLSFGPIHMAEVKNVREPLQYSEIFWE